MDKSIFQQVTPETLPEVVNCIRDIFQKINQTPYGEVNLTIKTHRNIPTNLITNVFKTVKFKDNQNNQAIKLLNGVIGEAIKRKETGQLSFTVAFSHGNIRMVINQYYDNKIYNNLTNNIK
jgi:hypothetical protein